MLNIKTGITFLIELRKETFINKPKYETKIIKGIVPKPKKTINKTDCRILPVDNAAASAKYTMPQGNQPLKKPMVNVLKVFFLMMALLKNS